ncbi:hypothetical protein DVH24_016640, partial [Malus domestica]
SLNSCHHASIVLKGLYVGSAIREALWICRKEGFSNLIVEYDARDMIRMVNKEIVVDASLESIMHNIWSIVNAVRAVSFEFTRSWGWKSSDTFCDNVCPKRLVYAQIVTSRPRLPPHPELDSTVTRYSALSPDHALTVLFLGTHTRISQWVTHLGPNHALTVLTSQWVTHPRNSLNFGVPMEPEANELPKGLMLGRDGNIHIRLTRSTPLGNVGCNTNRTYMD